MWGPDARLLAALHRAPGHLSASELAGEAGVSPAELAEGVRSLREAGFDLEQHVTYGYRLRAAPDRLVADDLWARLGLPAGGLWRRITVLAETSSTNDFALRLAAEGAAGGHLVIAEKQTAGRGRFGRRWQSAPHRGIWMSALLRPGFPLEHWPRLTVWAAVALAAAVDAVARVRSGIKWPNDVQVEWRKVAGILIEMSAPPAPAAVVGLGLNVNQAAVDFPPELVGTAGSLSMACGRQLDRADLLVRLLRELESRWPAVADDFPSLLAEAARRSTLLGRWVRVRLGDRFLEGLAERLDDEGHLLLRLAGGELQRLTAGEVTLQTASAWPDTASQGHG